jgi:polynucleotide 5'-kinase involved in rRNA processing
MVVGKIGSGKSSFIKALLNELEQVKGDSVYLNKNLAFCP